MLEYGARYDQDNYFSTVIDKENVAATTKGILDGEPVEFSGGDDMVIVTAAKGQTDTVDKTYAEIKELLDAGKPVAVKFPQSFPSVLGFLGYANNGVDILGYIFVANISSGSITLITCVKVEITSADVVTVDIGTKS